MSETAQIALRLAILLVAIPTLLLCSKWAVDICRARARQPERTAETEYYGTVGDSATACPSDAAANPSDSFRFSPELFEFRSDAIAKLQDHGYMWLSHYSAVDCLHDVYGLEVCGIREQNDALAIQKILMRMFPAWKPG